MQIPAQTLQRCGHRVRGLTLTLGLIAWLAGCGAGLGGTGTGDRSADLAAFGATATAVCSGSLGTVLGCGGGALPATQPGAVSFFSDSTGTRRARLEGNGIELQLLCSGLQFTGEWGTVSGQTPRFYGRISQAGGESLATLTADVLADSRLELRLFGLDGRLLAGPLTLVRSGAPSGVVICP